MELVGSDQLFEESFYTMSKQSSTNCEYQTPIKNRTEHSKRVKFHTLITQGKMTQALDSIKKEKKNDEELDSVDYYNRAKVS